MCGMFGISVGHESCDDIIRSSDAGQSRYMDVDTISGATMYGPPSDRVGFRKWATSAQLRGKAGKEVPAPAPCIPALR